jgi:hypothetical protein
MRIKLGIATLAVVATSLGVPVAEASPVKEQVTGWVNQDGTQYWSGPDIYYRELGRVNTGQGFEIICVIGSLGNTWYKGNLWGGRGGVWILAGSINTGGFIPQCTGGQIP